MAGANSDCGEARKEALRGSNPCLSWVFDEFLGVG